MLQVREHAISDPEFYANNLWKMLELRFTQARLNKIQGYLNEIGRVKHEANEDFKIFIDRFKKLIGDVRSIDPKQVPTDVNLMGILKESCHNKISCLLSCFRLKQFFRIFQNPEVLGRHK